MCVFTRHSFHFVYKVNVLFFFQICPCLRVPYVFNNKKNPTVSIIFFRNKMTLQENFYKILKREKKEKRKPTCAYL